MKNLELYSSNTSTTLPLPYAEEGIHAGFPSPAQDYMEVSIDLNKELVPHPSSTFYGRVKGDSMKEEAIDDGDILVIDKSLELMDDDLAVCFVDGEFTLKRVRIASDIIRLVPSNKEYPEIPVTAENDFIIWGIVTYTIKKNRRRRRK
ncbi:MAG: translesion error-prone DNA polymerase V autoproteolytic subunit [Bacteroides sp.]